MSRSLLSWAHEYLAHRRALGYRLCQEGKWLLRFGQYARRRRECRLTRELALRWAQLPRQAARAYWSRRLSIVRGFARYVAAFDARHQVPPDKAFGPTPPRPAPYVYRPDQIRQLLQRARGLSGGLRPHTHATLLGLLACTGLRIGEALRLTVEDVDLAQGVIRVRESKYHTTRLIPLHATTLEPLRTYAQQRQRRFPRALHFFVSRRGRALAYGVVQSRFVQLRAGLSSRRRQPRLHDLRHTFACRVLLQELQRPHPASDNRLAVLSRYLGHNRVADTYWYLTATPELLARAAQRYAAHLPLP
jgi:integrase/recombinase XerD